MFLAFKFQVLFLKKALRVRRRSKGHRRYRRFPTGPNLILTPIQPDFYVVCRQAGVDPSTLGEKRTTQII